MIFLNFISFLICKIFYPKVNGAEPIKIVGTVFLIQKIIGFNRFVPWPMHHTSRVINRKNIKVGNRTFPGWSQGCYIQAKSGIRIGHNLRMGPGVGLISANHDTDDYDQWLDVGPIIIGDNVWLGMNVVVLPGIQIGDNVVVAANSVVTKNIPSNSIAAGSPCKVIKEKAPYLGKDYSIL